MKPCWRATPSALLISEAIMPKSGAQASCPLPSGSNSIGIAIFRNGLIGMPPRIICSARGMLTVTTPSPLTCALPPRMAASCCVGSGVGGLDGMGWGSGVPVTLMAAIIARAIRSGSPMAR